MERPDMKIAKPRLKIRVRQRIERFRSFVKEQGFELHELLIRGKIMHPFIVNSTNEVAKIVITDRGTVHFTAREGRLKDRLSSWIAREGAPYHEHASIDDLAELDTYRERVASFGPSGLLAEATHFPMLDLNLPGHLPSIDDTMQFAGALIVQINVACKALDVLRSIDPETCAESSQTQEQWAVALHQLSIAHGMLQRAIELVHEEMIRHGDRETYAREESNLEGKGSVTGNSPYLDRLE